MQKITPNLWFDGKAKEAADFYVDAFGDGSIDEVTRYPESGAEGLLEFQLELAGKELTVEFSLAGTRFTAINAGPQFRFNPSMSLTVRFDPDLRDDANADLDRLWQRLIDGGRELMPLQEYDFSPYFGWVEDRYGLSWELMVPIGGSDRRPFIVPTLLFGGFAQNRAAEAVEFYSATFPASQRGITVRYEAAIGPAVPGSIMFADFRIGDQWLAAMDSGVHQDFSFNEAFSLAVACAGQDEINRYWASLSHYPESEQCGWCKDRFGVSWQVVPENMDELMKRPGAFATLMDQKKIVIDEY